MSDSKIASRYALSLYDKASETGVLESVATDIRSLNQVVSENRDFTKFLNSPLISRETKKNALNKIFTGFNKETLNLFHLMADKGRENLISFVGLEFMKIYNKQNSITEALVTSAAALDANSLKQVEQYVKAKTAAKAVQLTTKVDPSLVGGMTIMFEGKIYDNSIATQINKLKKELNIA
jgi:F-type H+-transporting ATPase subunit delta